MKSSEIAFISTSFKGGREINQDSVGQKVIAQGMRFVLADGLGGHGGGEIASKVAVERVLEGRENKLLDGDALRSLFSQAQDAIHLTQEGCEQKSMSTTLVILEVLNGQASWGHIGDSRLYLFREGEVFHQTKDHSVPQMLVATEEISMDEIRKHPARNRLLQALGYHQEIHPRISPMMTLKNNDTFLLCSDGFWEWVTEPDMEQALANTQSLEAWLDCLNEQIKERASDDDFDNYSALAVSYQVSQPWWGKWLEWSKKYTVGQGKK